MSSVQQLRMIDRPSRRRRKRGSMRWVGRVSAIAFVFLVPLPILLLLLFRFVPVPGTPQMLVSLAMGTGAHYRWVDAISPFLSRAVIASEDQKFCSHHGFD